MFKPLNITDSLLIKFFDEAIALVLFIIIVYNIYVQFIINRCRTNEF